MSGNMGLVGVRSFFQQVNSAEVNGDTVTPTIRVEIGAPTIQKTPDNLHKPATLTLA